MKILDVSREPRAAPGRELDALMRHMPTSGLGVRYEYASVTDGLQRVYSYRTRVCSPDDDAAISCRLPKHIREFIFSTGDIVKHIPPIDPSIAARNDGISCCIFVSFRCSRGCLPRGRPPPHYRRPRDGVQCSRTNAQPLRAPRQGKAAPIAPALCLLDDMA